MSRIKRTFSMLSKNASNAKTKILSFKGGLTILCLIIFIVYPLIVQAMTSTEGELYTYLDIFILAMLYAILGASWDLLAGITGLFSFGQAVFFGLSGYILAYGVVSWGFSSVFSLILGILVAVLFGLLIGAVCLRLKGPYLALTLLALSIVLYRLFAESEPIIKDIFKGTAGFPAVEHLFDSVMLVYFTYYIIMIASIAIMKILAESKFGTVLKAIRDDNVGAEASGINLSKYKIIIFAISALFAGLAGGLWVMHVGSVKPENFGTKFSFFPIMFAAVGGLSSISGAVLGAFLYQIIDAIFTYGINYLPGITEIPFVSDVLAVGSVLIFAILLVIIIRWAPNGILNPAIEKLRLAYELIKGN
ncbi:MAG: branched-chain amino acid ABC transporter permease [Candidatus Lokiarchaeota archaeon]|nr:branched-chain amino acid ABC transporter permease [Candidatus Lokiarchaeota archaeon]